MLTLQKRTKSLIAVVVAAVIGASSSVGAFAQTGSSSLLSGDSSAVGSGGFATANLSYASAWVSGPASSPRTFTASSPTTAAAAAVGSSASASTTPGTQTTSGSSTSAPVGGLPPIQLPGLPPIQLPGLPPIQLPTGSTVPSVQTSTVTDALNAALDKIRQLGIDVPDLPDVPLPPVSGLEVKAALVLLLTTVQTQTTATMAAARTATLAAIAKSGSDFGTQATAIFDQAAAISTAAFDRALAAVLAMDPAQLNNMPGEVIPALAAAQLTVVQKLTQAMAALVAAAEQLA